MALAFPGKSGELWEVIARDAFLEAFADAELRFRVAEKDPSTLEEALRFACRLESLRRPESTEWDAHVRRRDRVVRFVQPAAEEAERVCDDRRRLRRDGAPNCPRDC